MSDQQKERIPNAELIPAQEADSAVTIDLVEMLYHLLASWKLLVSFAVIFAVFAGVYTQYFVTPMYQATATIYVVSPSDSAIKVSDLQLGSALTSDYIKVFKMWELHDEVAEKLDLSYSYGALRGMLSVHNEEGTRMLDLTVTCADPQLAADIANAYAVVGSEFIAETMSTDKPNIMSVALAPANPVSPNKTRNIAIAFMLGGALAAGIVIIRVLLDDKFKTADEIRRYTGMVTLAVVPVEETEKNEKKKTSRREA